MWTLTVEEILKVTGGETLGLRADGVNGVGTDTRQNLKGQLFVALKGDVYDAHRFLDEAAKQGAAALLVHEFDPKFDHLKNSITIIRVADTLKALQKLGHFWRLKMRAKIFGITGTNGKTTTKEFTAALLSSKFSTQYSKGSFNNHWGVPISLLSIAPEHEMAIIEMGMNHAGEIKELVQLAEPDIVVVTMVGRGHLEGLGTIEAVSKAKSEIYEFAPARTQFIFNIENTHTRAMYSRYANKSSIEPLLFASADSDIVVKVMGQDNLGLSPGLRGKLAVSFKIDESDAESITVSGHIQGVKGRAKVHVFGIHNVTNLMAAACCALTAGMTPDEIWRALPECRGGWGRNQWVATTAGTKVLFDAYNANPESMRAAIENFARLTAGAGGRKIGVFAEMREMGEAAPLVHNELGATVAGAGFDEVIFIGPSRAEFVQGATDAGINKKPMVSDSCEEFLASGALPVLHPNDIVLMKGSRGMALERLLEPWGPVDFKLK